MDWCDKKNVSFFAYRRAAILFSFGPHRTGTPSRWRAITELLPGFSLFICFTFVLGQGCRVRLQPPSHQRLPAFNPFLPPPAITQILLISSIDLVRHYRVLPSFTGFYWVLPSFTGFLVGFTGFYRVLPGFTGFYRVTSGCYRVLSGFTGFYRVLHSVAWFYLVLLAFIPSVVEFVWVFIFNLMEFFFICSPWLWKFWVAEFHFLFHEIKTDR